MKGKSDPLVHDESVLPHRFAGSVRLRIAS
jgi:hypothetical protein